jgi:uncharacterized membrane protein
MLATVLLAACNYHDDRSVDDAGDESPGESPHESIPAVAPDFAEVTAKVFKPRCNSCHNAALMQGNTRLDTYANAKEKADEVREQVFELKLMPQGSSLTEDESWLLKAWLDADAPQVVPMP